MPSAAGVPCISSIQIDDEGIVVANGSSKNHFTDWKRDLMEKNCSGSIWRVQDDGQIGQLASKLAFPYGLVRTSNGAHVYVESWRHRISIVGDNGLNKVLLSDLPAYPGRITHAEGGGYWLTAFAPRTQMVEFMLGEDRARREMISTVHPDYWMAPRFASGKSFREPLQGGGIKQLGILKPWAPSQSYGLIIRLDPDLQPISSYHSRADGNIHGVSSCLQVGSRLYACSKGADFLVALELDQLEGSNQ